MNTKVYEWTDEERESLKNAVIENCQNFLSDEYQISVVGSFANTKMTIEENSDIDVVIWQGDRYVGKIAKFLWGGRLVNVVMRKLSAYPTNRFWGEQLSHYSLTENQFFEGVDDEKRAFKKGRLIGDIVHCDFCGAEVNKNEILQLQVLISKHGIVREKFVCEKCYNEEKYINC